MEYAIENLVPCCKVCNRAKGKMHRDDFLDWINQVYECQNELIQEGFNKQMEKMGW